MKTNPPNRSKYEQINLFCVVFTLCLIFNYDAGLFLAIIIALTISEASIIFLDYCEYVIEQYMSYVQLYFEQSK